MDSASQLDTSVFRDSFVYVHSFNPSFGMNIKTTSLDDGIYIDYICKYASIYGHDLFRIFVTPPRVKRRIIRKKRGAGWRYSAKVVEPTWGSLVKSSRRPSESVNFGRSSGGRIREPVTMLMRNQAEIVKEGPTNKMTDLAIVLKQMAAHSPKGRPASSPALTYRIVLPY